MKDYVDSAKLQEYTTKLVTKLKTIFPGTPTAVLTAAEMTDHGKIYVYAGTETGYTAGDWYYWDGSAWASGGVYNAEAIVTDTTLSVPGMAADAAVTGGEIADEKTRLDATSEGCADGTAVLLSDVVYQVGDDLKTLNISASPRFAKYENGILKYEYKSTGAITGSFGVNFQSGNSGILFTDDVWIAFDKNANQYIDFEYYLDIPGVTPGGTATKVNIGYALRLLRSDTEDVKNGTYWFDVTKTHDRINMKLTDFLAALFSEAVYNTITHISLYGITSGAIVAPGAIDVKLSFKGVYVRAEDGMNLADKYAYVKEKAEDAYDLADDANTLATADHETLENIAEITDETYAVVNGDNIISDSTYMLRAGLPSYYTAMPEDPTSFTDLPYIDGKIEEIPDAEKRLIYFSDCHWDDNRNGRHSPELIQYVRQRKNIPNVAFGGDYIEIQRGSGAIKGKYLARQWASDFVYRMLCTAGSAYLPVFGNHDTNYAIGDTTPEYPDDVFLPYSQIRKMEFSNLPKNAHTQFEFERERIDLEEFAGANYDEFAEYLKMSYYFDDVKNKVRYIVLNSGAKEPAGGVIDTIFGISGGTQVNTGAIGGLYINLIWYYNALKSVPEGYDVIVLVHELITLGGSSGYQLRNVMLAMGLKTRTNKALYFEQKTDKLIEWCGWETGGVKTFDFTTANQVGKVFFIIGHDHRDGIAVFKQDTAVNGSYSNPVVEWAEDQSDVSVDQNTVQTTPTAPPGYTTDNTKGCDIPVILVARDKTEDGETGTVNEQRFDVVSITDDAVDLTRFGKGDNRHIAFA